MNSPEQPHAGISRDSLSRGVRRYDDNLDTQARLLFDKYKLPHYDTDILLAASEDMTASLSSDSYFVHLYSQGPRVVVSKYPLAVLDPMRGFYLSR